MENGSYGDAFLRWALVLREFSGRLFVRLGHDGDFWRISYWLQRHGSRYTGYMEATVKLQSRDTR
jgi:hypothetical protein